MSLAFEQREKESAKAFEAFSVYLNMGAERSLAAVGQKLGKSGSLIERWSTKFEWSSRVQAHAAHLAVAEREATEAVARAKALDWGKRQHTLREREWEMHEQCIAAAKRALNAFMEREKVYANLSDIARILEIASKLGRLASGMATDKTEMVGEVGMGLSPQFEAMLKKIYDQPEAGHTIVDVEEVNGRCHLTLPSPQSGEGRSVKEVEVLPHGHQGSPVQIKGGRHES
jgi:hypothetical protein